MHNPTPEQVDILREAAGSADLMVRARAGCGKTTTIVMVSEVLPLQGAGLALAFNVKIKEELTARLPSSIQCLTLNGLGHKAWALQLGRQPKVDSKKPYTVVDEVCKKQGIHLSKDERGDLVSLLNHSRTSGWLPKGLPPGLTAAPSRRDDEESIRDLFDYADVDYSVDLEILLRAAALRSIALGFAGEIDFIDQIYLPVVFSAPVPKYDTVLVDEAQDLSLLNHRLILRACKRRLIVVGDEKQAIYGFRGASATSMDDLRAKRTFVELPLTMTFRCAKAIVRRAQDYVPDFRAYEGNPEGEVLDWTRFDSPGWSASDIPPAAAIICRNNAPLLSLAFKLIKAGRGCKMLGNDIGVALQRRLKKATSGLFPNASSESMLASIERWRDTELRKAKSDRKVASIEDTYDCLRAICSEAETLAGAEKFCKDLFADKAAVVTLCSGHKAKGLEWDTVIHLDPFRIPSKYAKTLEQRGQEFNIKYVIETRAKTRLILANLDDFHADS